MLASRASLRSGCLRGTQLSSTRRYHGLAQSKFFQVSEEVRDAVATGKPVVSLETTIYTHGKSSVFTPGSEELCSKAGKPRLIGCRFPLP